MLMHSSKESRKRPLASALNLLKFQYPRQLPAQLFVLDDKHPAYLPGHIDALAAEGHAHHQPAVFEPLLHIAVDHAPKRRRNAVHAENGDHVHIGVDGRLAALARENVGDGVVGRLRPFLRQLRHAKDAHSVPLAALQRVGIHGHSAFGLRHRRFHRGIPILPQDPAQNPRKFFIRSIRARKNLRLHRLWLHPAEYRKEYDHQYSRHKAYDPGNSHNDIRYCFRNKYANGNATRENDSE